MVLGLRALLFVGGLFFCVVGLGFLFDPATSASGIGLSAKGAMGLTTLRADMTALFLVAGGCMIWGGWARNGDPLLVTAALMGVALLGRIVGLIQDGSYDGFAQPIAIEAIIAIVALIASRVLPHHALSPEDG